MRIVLVLAALVIASPAIAQQSPVNLVVQNMSTDTVESISVFPVGTQTVVGTYTTPIAPGQAGRVDLALGQCQPIEVAVVIAGNPTPFRPSVDLCTDPMLTVGE